MTCHICAKTNCIGECEPKIQLDDMPAQQEDYKTLEQALTRLQKRYGELESKAQRTWVGLTDEDIQKIWRSSEHMNEVEVCRAIESKLKEKNT